MPGPTQPGFYGRSPQMPDMSEADAIKSEQGYYGPPTPEMMQPPLDVVPTNLWKHYPNIDLADPPQSDPGAMEALMASAKKPPGTEGMWFVDQVEDGIAVVEDPEGNTTTMRAQPSWKEGMHIAPPKPAQPRKRRAVP